MAQHGFVFRKGDSWFLRYRHNVTIDGVQVRKQKCVKLADYCDRYRCERDLDDLVAAKMAAVRQAAKCPQSGRMFTAFIEETYLPYVKEEKKPQPTLAGKHIMSATLSQDLRSTLSLTYRSRLSLDC